MLAGEKIQPQFTYNTWALFATYGEMIKYFNETGCFKLFVSERVR